MERVDRILPTVTRPARYTGAELNSIVKDWAKTPIRVALLYPDVYEAGATDPILQSIYTAVNQREDALCQRVFCPWPDMAATLRQAQIPLFSLEEIRPLTDFHILAFYLPDELGAATVLEMLDLAGLPLRAQERTSQHPIVLGVGPLTANPHPLAPFLDAVLTGDPEALATILPYLRDRQDGPGIHWAGRPGHGGDVWLDPLPSPVLHPIVPYVETSHDRAVVEMGRPGPRGYRERPRDEILATVDRVIRSTGYDDIALDGEHRETEAIAVTLGMRYTGYPVRITIQRLPATPVAVAWADRLPDPRRGTLTLIVGAASERLRQNFPPTLRDDEIIAAGRQTCRRGWHTLRLRATIGVPGEERSDIQALIDLVQQMHRVLLSDPTTRTATITLVVEPFIPRARTPWEQNGAMPEQELRLRLGMLQRGIRGQGLRLLTYGCETYTLRAAIARGGREVAPVIEHAWRHGARLDTWHEHHRPDIWEDAWAAHGLDPMTIATRSYEMTTSLPWREPG
jgi:radical SAM superfamily enzyme YgiQ (UPF0313 family)